MFVLQAASYSAIKDPAMYVWDILANIPGKNQGLFPVFLNIGYQPSPPSSTSELHSQPLSSPLVRPQSQPQPQELVRPEPQPREHAQLQSVPWKRLLAETEPLPSTHVGFNIVRDEHDSEDTFESLNVNSNSGVEVVPAENSISRSAKREQEYADAAKSIASLSVPNPIPHDLFPPKPPPPQAAQPHFSGSHIAMGGLSDSAYEYMLKQYILDGKQNPQLLEMYTEAMRGMRDLLVGQTQSGASALPVVLSLVFRPDNAGTVVTQLFSLQVMNKVGC